MLAFLLVAFFAIALFSAGIGILLRSYDKKCGTKRGGKGGRKGRWAFVPVALALLGASAVDAAPRKVCDGNTCRIVDDGQPVAAACSSGACSAGPVRRVFSSQPVRGALRRLLGR